MPVLHELKSACYQDTAKAKRIAGYIRDTKGNDYLQALRGETDFEVFCCLSDFPIGLLGWYPFRPGSSVLEMGGNFGERTGALLRACGHVTVTEPSFLRAQGICERYPEADHLEVYAGAWEELPSEGAFDYIVVAGGLETAGKGSEDLREYVEYIGKLKTLLRPGGILLVAVENRYGLRYFCGERERHTGRPFAGIGHTMQGAGGRPFSKAELMEIFHRADMAYVKFYYPLPDYRMPQLVYTDAHLPEANIYERLILYHEAKDTLVADEKKLYRDIISNGVFPFFANSYLPECGLKENGSNVSYVALSTDRGRDKAMATAIHENGIVTKHPVFEVGRAYVRGLLKKAGRLRDHHVPVLEQRWDGAGISMPYVPSRTLAMHLRHCVRENLQEFYELLDRLWEIILVSSEHVPAELNALSDRRDLPWGPILREASIELIPVNCFYDGGELLYFDQEYVRENYPAKYVLFRAIYYIYVFDPGAEAYVPIQSLKERYGLVELWEIFREEETEKFLPEVRQHEGYCLFYRQVSPDAGRIQRNIAMLMAGDALSPQKL